MEYHNRPFSSISDSSIAIYIHAKYKDCTKVEFIFNTINKFFGTNFGNTELNNFFGRIDYFKDKFPLPLIRNREIIDEKLDEICDAKTCALHFKFKNCLFCSEILEIKNTFKAQYYYYAKASETCIINSLWCKKCKTNFFPSYFILNTGVRKFYEFSLDEQLHCIVGRNCF